jgi:hypothetical protein
MSTHDYIVDNQNGANFRSDLNNALAAIVSNNSSATAPSTTYAFMMWADTANDLLKQRNAADSAWVDILTLSTGAVSNAEVADNAITLAKMAGGTDGNLITYDASGDPAYVTTGTSGQVLTSGGVGVAPTFQTAASGGAWAVVASGTFSGATFFNFPIGSKPTVIHIWNWNQSSGDQIETRTSSDGGATFDSGASDYRGHIQQWEGSNITNSYPSAGSTGQITYGAPNGGTDKEVNIEIAVMNPNNPTTYGGISTKYKGIINNDYMTCQSIFNRRAASDIDAVQILCGSVNISGSYAITELN